MNILILNGPNLNVLGQRDPEMYGSKTLSDVKSDLDKTAEYLNVCLSHFQSNAESEIIDHIQSHRDKMDGVIINAGALTHYGLTLRDSLIDARLPIVEVHISNVHARDEYRSRSIVADIAVGQIAGLGWKGYSLALAALVNHLETLT